MNGPGGQKAAFKAGFLLLCGDDDILRGHARSDAMATADGGDERYNAGEGDFASFSERIITPSLLSTARTFLITDVHLLDEKDLALLAGLFEYDLPDACVVLETDRPRSARPKKSKEAGLSGKFLSFLERFEEKAQTSPERFSIREFIKPPDYKMAEWVAEQASRLFGRRIAKADAEHLVDLAGADTAVLCSELQKIDLFLPDKAAIDANVIDEVAGATRSMTPQELATALGKKDLGRALEIIESVFSANVYLPLFVGSIFRHFWSMFKIREFEKVNPDVVRRFKASLNDYKKRQQQEETGAAIGAAAGLFSEKQVKSVYPVLVKSGIVDQALSFEAGHYKSIFKMLREYDAGLKTGRADDSRTGFELFCYRIVRPQVSRL